MIVFIETLGCEEGNLDNYFSVVDVVYKRDDKGLNSFINRVSKCNPSFRVIKKIEGTIERYKLLKNHLCKNFKACRGDNWFYLSDELREFIMGLDQG